MRKPMAAIPPVRETGIVEDGELIIGGGSVPIIARTAANDRYLRGIARAAMKLTAAKHYLDKAEANEILADACAAARKAGLRI